MLNSGVKNTLMVSGRAGFALIDELYENNMVPPSTISNIIVFCNSEDKVKKAKVAFGNKDYPIDIDFIVYDKEREFLKPIAVKIQQCLNGTVERKEQKKLAPDFENISPADIAAGNV